MSINRNEEHLLKKQKNAFDILKQAQEKTKIVLSKSPKITQQDLQKASTNNTKKRKYDDITPDSQQKPLFPSGPAAKEKPKDQRFDDSNPFRDLLPASANPANCRTLRNGSIKDSQESFSSSQEQSQTSKAYPLGSDIQEIQSSKPILSRRDESYSPVRPKKVLINKKVTIVTQTQTSSTQDLPQSQQLLANPSRVNNLNGSYKSYSTEFKEEFIETYIEVGLTKACLRKGVTIDLASKWVKKFKEEGLLGLVDKRVQNSGPYNKFLDLYVLEEFKKKRNKGIMVNGLLLKAIALQSPAAYKPDNFQASNGWLSRFIARNRIVKRKKTRQTQAVFERLNIEMINYLEVLKTLQEFDDELVFVNFDEVPVFFDLSSDYTYELKGQKDITSLNHARDKTRISVTLGIASNGDVLSPLLTFIYKYASKGTRTFPKKFEEFKNRTKPYMLRFSESGFNNDNIIIDYIDKIIVEWKASLNKEVVLVMDQAKCHISDKVLKHLDNLRLTYILIPAGGTCLFQPLDVALNKPFKDDLRCSYFSWLENQVSVNNVKVLECPEVERMIDWSVKAAANINSLKVTDAFRLSAITGNLEESFNQQELNRKLQILVDLHLQSEEEIEPEYMDDGDNQLQILAFGQELYLEE